MASPKTKRLRRRNDAARRLQIVMEGDGVETFLGFAFTRASALPIALREGLTVAKLLKARTELERQFAALEKL